TTQQTAFLGWFCAELGDRPVEQRQSFPRLACEVELLAGGAGRLSRELGKSGLHGHALSGLREFQGFPLLARVRIQLADHDHLLDCVRMLERTVLTLDRALGATQQFLRRERSTGRSGFT